MLNFRLRANVNFELLVGIFSFYCHCFVIIITNITLTFTNLLVQAVTLTTLAKQIRISRHTDMSTSLMIGRHIYSNT